MRESAVLNKQLFIRPDAFASVVKNLAVDKL